MCLQPGSGAWESSQQPLRGFHQGFSPQGLLHVWDGSRDPAQGNPQHNSGSSQCPRIAPGQGEMLRNNLPKENSTLELRGQSLGSWNFTFFSFLPPLQPPSTQGLAEGGEILPHSGPPPCSWIFVVSVLLSEFFCAFNRGLLCVYCHCEKWEKSGKQFSPPNNFSLSWTRSLSIFDNPGPNYWLPQGQKTHQASGELQQFTRAEKRVRKSLQPIWGKQRFEQVRNSRCCKPKLSVPFSSSGHQPCWQKPAGIEGNSSKQPQPSRGHVHTALRSLQEWRAAVPGLHNLSMKEFLSFALNSWKGQQE